MLEPIIAKLPIKVSDYMLRVIAFLCCLQCLSNNNNNTLKTGRKLAICLSFSSAVVKA